MSVLKLLYSKNQFKMADLLCSAEDVQQRGMLAQSRAPEAHFVNSDGI